MVRAGAPDASGERRAEHHGERKKEPEERHHEGERLDVGGTRGSLLHGITPVPTDPLPVDRTWTAAVARALREEPEREG
jgi:hypothetical protein